MRTKLLAATTLGLAVLVAACGGGGATTAPTAAPTDAPTDAPAPPAAGGATVNLAETSLGTILVDGAGKTLYIFTPDGTDGKSTCTGDCLATWPALTSDGPPTLGAGLTAADFGSITRTDDGTTQVTFHGMPLYFFAADQAAGDTNGQGLNDRWYVVDAAGTIIR